MSAHLVVRGRVRVRHYDRLHDEPHHLLLRPSRDGSQRQCHWLVANAEPALTFDVVVDGLDARLPFAYRQTFVDVDGVERRSDGSLRAGAAGGGGNRKI